MKTIKIELPDQLANELDHLVNIGWFHNEKEGIRIILKEYLTRHNPDLQERFQREDIEWALMQSEEIKS